MNKKVLLIVLLILIILGVGVFFSYKYFTGNVVENKVICLDSDGLNYSEKGKVSFGDISKEDSCLRGFNLIEYFCDDSSGNEKINSKVYACPVRCFDGACVNSLFG